MFDKFSLWIIWGRSLDAEAEPGGRGVLRDPIVRGPVTTLGPLKAYTK